MVVSLVVVIFIIVLFLMDVFAIAHYCKMHNIAPNWATTVDALISLSAEVQEVSPEG